MKNINRYIYLLLFCIFLQNDNASVVNFLRSLVDLNDELSLFLKNSDNSPLEEENEESEKNEKNENESKENEEKEKEFKNIKLLHSFVFLSVAERKRTFRNSEDSKLFSLDSDTETPPPQNISEA